MKKNGFVQIPILIAIAVGVVVISGASYFFIHKNLSKNNPQPVNLSTNSSVDNTNTSNIKTENNTKEISKNIIVDTKKASNNAPVDVCINIEGLQTSIPLGMKLDGTTCSTIKPVQILTSTPIVDVCNEIEGVQTVVPTGYIKYGSGPCVLLPQNTTSPTVENPVVIASVGPGSFKRSDADKPYVTFLLNNTSKQTVVIKSVSYDKSSNGIVPNDADTISVTVNNAPEETRPISSNFIFNNPLFILAGNTAQIGFKYNYKSASLSYGITKFKLILNGITTDNTVSVNLPIASEVIYSNN
jgi:hypothetical protein